MSGQNTLVVKATPLQALRPSSSYEVQFFRDTAPAGLGQYFTIDKNGVIEMVGGAGMGTIAGGGTLNYIPKFTPDGTTIGDSSLFDDGNIGYNTVTPNSVAAFDVVSTTKGMLFPRMTTVQRDAIVTGASTDGLFIYNTTTEKFNFWNQTLGAWESIDTSTGGDVSGLGTTNFITKWTDGPNSIIGDSLVFDNGTSIGIGTIVPAASNLVNIEGSGITSATNSLSIENSALDHNFSVRDDRQVFVNFLQVGTVLTGTEVASTVAIKVVGDTAVASARFFSSVNDELMYLGVNGVTASLIQQFKIAPPGVFPGTMTQFHSEPFQPNFLYNNGGLDIGSVGTSADTALGNGTQLKLNSCNVGGDEDLLMIARGGTNIGSIGQNAAANYIFFMHAVEPQASLHIGVQNNFSTIVIDEFANVGIGTVTRGADAVNELSIANGTPPTALVANQIQIYSTDSSDVTSTLGLFLEQAEEAIGITVATNKIKVIINGNERYLLLSTI